MSWLLPAVAAGAGPVSDLAGTWIARTEVAGEPGSFVLHLEDDGEGGLSALISLPQMGLERLPAGHARRAEDGIEVAGTRFEWDGERLVGPLPDALVPVHEIIVALERGDPPPPLTPADRGPVIRPAWRFPVGAPVYAGITAGGGRVYAATDAGRVLALDTDGRLLWSFDAGGPVRATPTLARGRLFVPADDGDLYCLDTAGGTLVWRVPLGPGPAPRSRPGTPGYRYDRYASAAVVADGRLFVGTLHGEMLALDPDDGSIRWRFRAGDAVESTPTVAGGRVYFGSYDGRVYALEAADGGLAWRSDTGAPVVSTPAVDAGIVVIGSRSYDLLGLDAATGETVWRRYYWYSWVESSARVRHGIAYIGSSDGRHVSAWRVADGKRVWRYRAGGPAWASPAVTAGLVLEGTVGVPGYLVPHRPAFHALDRTSGKPVWHYPAAPPDTGEYTGFVSAPAVAGDRVYVGGLDGAIYAFPLVPAQ